MHVVPCEDNGETFVAPIIDFERPGVKKRKAKVQAAATLYIQKKKLKTAQAPGGVTGGDPGVQSSHTVALPIMAATTDHEAPGGVTGGDPGVQSSHILTQPNIAAAVDHEAPGGVTGGAPGVQSSHTVAQPNMAAALDHEVS
ncbi:hypothetical protein CYMTET_24230 [Cymbomonas tetramitiformis]|uniref:Uncharacterized protein n=1 Tax=Cymbomonas tetramitiformis TaxID=36881 RepID=A0AAE0FXM3_9CHLO|nr:hypothetical protein CYMTET_24230 [Cymbomonas tetramitiformis]